MAAAKTPKKSPKKKSPKKSPTKPSRKTAPKDAIGSIARKWRARFDAAQEALATHGIGQGGSFFYDQTTQVLTFTLPRNATHDVVAKASILGSYSAGNWMWGWANTTVLPQAARASAQLKARAKTLGIPEFATKSFDIEDAKVGTMLVAAFGVLEPEGFYFFMSPDKRRRTVLVIESLAHVPRAAKATKAVKKKAAKKKAVKKATERGRAKPGKAKRSR
jgi:hypothetical protein